METIFKDGVIEISEGMFLTDKLRDRAKKVLPAYMDYVIMTRENIKMMLPEGKAVEDCAGECLVETGRNISANYIAQARVGKFGDQLTLTVELYETMGNNLLGGFTAMGANSMALLQEIERQADGMFAMVSAGKTGGGNFGGSDGISGLEMGGSGYKAAGTKSVIMEVNSDPAGAIFSVDGRPNTSCSKTPCSIQLKPGSHRFSFGLDMYFDKDTLVDVDENSSRLDVSLMPNFGIFTLSPKLLTGVGKAADLKMTIDGENVQQGSRRLSPGTYAVTISHQCYEDVRFNVSIKTGSDIKFDRELVAAQGGLELNVLDNGKPKAVFVYVNAAKAGVTPFLETVPVCSKIEVGDNRDEVKVNLKKNETVTYVYDLADALFFTDTRDGQKYKTVKIGKQVWMAQNLNYETGNSRCYNSDAANCKKYGRLYDWNTAKKACPVGWHLPSSDEFKILRYTVGRR